MNKIIRFALIAAAMTLVFSLTVLAAVRSNTTAAAPARTNAYGYCVGGHNFMWDADGNMLSREDAEALLDQYIADGYILDTEKDYYLEMYDYCAERGWNSLGCGFGRRAGGGMGGGCCGRR